MDVPEGLRGCLPPEGCQPLPDADHLATGGAQLRPHTRRGGDAAVGDVDRAVGSGSEAGWEEQLADAKVRAVTAAADAHHITGRALGAEAAGLEFGGVERAIAAEPAALHGGQAPGPDRRG